MIVTEALKFLNLPSQDHLVADIKLAYRTAMREWHPDRFQKESDITVATKKAQEINFAYELITEHIEEYGSIQLQANSHNNIEYEPSHTHNRCQFTPGFPDPTVFEVFMKSSNVVSAGYNLWRSVLYVKFQNGYVYEYIDVPRDIWDAFQKAESHGKFGNTYIFHTYNYRRCTEANQPYSPHEAVMSRRSAKARAKLPLRSSPLA